MILVSIICQFEEHPNGNKRKYEFFAYSTNKGNCCLRTVCVWSPLEHIRFNIHIHDIGGSCTMFCLPHYLTFNRALNGGNCL